MGRYWGDVAIVCFCKLTPGSGLSFMSLSPPLSFVIAPSVHTGGPNALSVIDATDFGESLSVFTLLDGGTSLTSLHPVDNPFAKCCVCTVLVTGYGQDEVNGTYCKIQKTDTVFLREGNSQLKIEL